MNEIALTAQKSSADRRQRRASFQQARSHQTKQALIEAAHQMARGLLDKPYELDDVTARLPHHVDAAQLATVAQSLVSEGARRRAEGSYGKHSFADVVGRDIAALAAGHGALTGSPSPAGEPFAFAPGKSRSNIRK